MTRYEAIPCRCGYNKCPDWHVSNVADVQGVHFTKAQAEAVATLLNRMKMDHEKIESLQ
jgi:hypothetical protein